MVNAGMGETILSGIIFTLLLFVCGNSAFHCKMSNEGCGEDSECCSNDCYRAHEGTNPRCTKTAMGEPCFENYQCEGSMECGTLYQCCAAYWGDCVKEVDCCDTRHVCIRVTGFVYKKCLYPGGGGSVPLTSSLPMLVIVAIVTDAIRYLIAS